jgi:hypothetical protein
MTDHIVVFDGPRSLAGQLVQVTIEDASAFTLYGSPLEVGDGGDATVEASPLPGRLSLPLI